MFIFIFYMGENGQAFIDLVFNTFNWPENEEGQKCKPMKGVTATLVQRYLDETVVCYRNFIYGAVYG